MKYLFSDIPLGLVKQNIAVMLRDNVLRYTENVVYQEKRNEVYEGITWSHFFNDIQNIAFNLCSYGFKAGDKVLVFSPNCLDMLELELAVMASGGISVPIFAHFNRETAAELIRFSDARIVVAGGLSQFQNIDPDLPLDHIFVMGSEAESVKNGFHHFSVLRKERNDHSFSLRYDAPADTVCLAMFTSGTMGVPKCVQLTHRNILSQQAALSQIWQLDENDRFLSYLPWHHSFGGIFERFSALYNGATLSLDSGYGKDPKVIFANWKQIRPTLFFSVPKVYQALLQLAKLDNEAEDLLFHSGLKFVFTAAAPLPTRLSDEFEQHGIKVLEGWGLTETSPCCTLTDPALKREAGVVGIPIPGVSVRIDEEEENEIQVTGPNVMMGYYNNPEANKRAFTEDGWFKTGDIGEITESGLKLVSRRDRIFKLINGEKVIPTDVEMAIHSKCHYIQFAVVMGSGKEFPVALLFPNRKMLMEPTYELSPEEGCFCPRNLEELSRCLRGCLKEANCCIGEKFSRIRRAMIIDAELSVESNTLTPSMKIVPNNVLEIYKAHVEHLYFHDKPDSEPVYVVKLEENV